MKRFAIICRSGLSGRSWQLGQNKPRSCPPTGRSSSHHRLRPSHKSITAAVLGRRRWQTPEGAALQGMSQVISAQGQANLANSAAAINWTQAESNSSCKTRSRACRPSGRCATSAGTSARKSAARAPRRRTLPAVRPRRQPRQLNTNQIDPVTGELHWPSALQQDMFNEQRARSTNTRRSG